MSNDNQSSEVKTKNITFGFVIAWIFAVIVGIPGIMMLFESGNQVAGLLFILAALVALPPFNAFIKSKSNIGLSGGLRFALIVVLCIVAGVVASKGPASSSDVSVPAASDAAAGTQQAAPQVLLNIKGNGTKTTQTFITAGAWDLSYTYDCSNFGAQQGNFIVYVYNSDGSMSLSNTGVNQLGKSGSDVNHYHTGGSFYLTINSECAWTVTVTG